MHQSSPHTHEEQGLKKAFWINFGFSIFELIGGILSGSVAVIADAIHDAGDSISILLAWILARLSKGGRTDGFSYGKGRLSLLGAFINSAILVVGSIGIFIHAVPKLWDPTPTNSLLMMGMAVVGVAVNGYAVWSLRTGETLNAQAISLHLFEDVLGWVAVLVGSIMIYFTGWYLIDAILAVGIAVYIFFHALQIAKPCVRIFLQAIPEGLDLAVLTQKIQDVKGVESLHDLHVWSMDGVRHVASLHVVLQAESDAAQVKSVIRHSLEHQGIDHVTIEVEGVDEPCGLRNV